MKNIAIIPARSGSKGLPDKNILSFCGKPLLAYSIEVAKQSGKFDAIYVSTDSEHYAEIACQYGAEVPFLRPSAFATDEAGVWDMVREVFIKYQERGRFFDTAMLLQPTSPLRTAADICNAYEVYNEKAADFVVSVCEAEHSPLWMNQLPKNDSMKGFLKKELLDTPRQDLPKYYRMNGSIFLVRKEFLFRVLDLYEGNCFAVHTPAERSVDIDTETDFKMAEFLYRYFQEKDEKRKESR